MDAVRRKILTRALESHQEFLEQKSEDASVRKEAGQAFMQVGDIYTKLGDFRKAEESYAQAIRLFRGRPDSSKPDHPQALGEAYFQQAELLRRTRPSDGGGSGMP